MPDPRQPGNESDVAVLREVLESDLAASGQVPSGAMLLALTGLPGSGKSYFAAELVKLTPFLVLETDRLRKVLVAQPRYTPGEHRRVFGSCHALIAEFLGRGHRVLFDATNLTESFRDPLYGIAQGLGIPSAMVRLSAPVETIRRRLRSREAGLDPDTNSDAGWLIYCRMAPAWEEVQRDHFHADSSADITPVLDEVVRWVESGGQEHRASSNSHGEIRQPAR